MSTCPCHEWLSVHQIIRDKITKKKSNGSAFLTYFIFSFLNSSHVFLTLLHIFVYLVCNPCTRFISELLNSLFLSRSFPYFLLFQGVRCCSMKPTVKVLRSRSCLLATPSWLKTASSRQFLNTPRGRTCSA